MRRPALLVALVGAAAVVFKKRSKAQQAERELWTEATSKPDLR